MIGPDHSYEQIVAALTDAGLPAASFDQIIEIISQSSNREFVDRACPTGQGAKIALGVAIVLAGKITNHAEHTNLLLNYLTRHYSDLDPADRGMYWHIKGYYCWKVESTPYPAIRYLNLSRQNLEAAATGLTAFYQARVYDTLGQIAYARGYYKEAEEDYEEALRIREQFNDHYGKALTYGNLGRLHMDTGNFAAAHHYFERDLEIIQVHFPEMERIKIQLLSHLGSCLYEQQKFGLARSFFQQSQLSAETLSDVTGQVFALIGLGRINLAEGKLSEAIRYRDLAQTQVDQHFDPITQRGFYGLLNHLSAQILCAGQRYSQALALFENAYQQYNAFPSFSPVHRARLLYDYAQAAMQVDEPAIASSLLLEALGYLDNSSAETLRQKVEQEMKTNFRKAWLQHSIRRFTGLKKMEHLLEEAGQDGFRGENQKVVVLVTDIRNFTGISENFDPQDLVLFINEYFARMIRCIDHFQGYVDKIIGDAIMSIFSLPSPKRDDSTRAITAALMMQEELNKFNLRLPSQMQGLQIGTGIHFGKVVAGLIGSPAKRSYTILGDTVNTAFRLEEMTKELGASLLVTESLINRLDNREQYLFRPLGRYCPRGRREAISVYELLGLKELSYDLDRSLSSIEDSHQALAMFYDHQFENASACFSRLYESTGINAFHLLRNTAEGFLKKAPPKDWTGEIMLRNK